MDTSSTCLKVQVLHQQENNKSKEVHFYFARSALFVADENGYHFYIITDEKGMNCAIDMSCVRFLTACESAQIEKLRSQNKTDNEIGNHLLKQAGL